MNTSRPLLSATGITVRFAHGRGRSRHDMTAVDDVSLSVGRGEIVGLVGESGSGKSTFARVICGLQRRYGGTVTFDGQPLEYERSRAQWRHVQMVFQDPFASLDPRMTVEAMLSELLRFHRLAPRSEWRRRAAEVLDMVSLPRTFLDKTPVTMSGGQRQRVAIARTLVLRPQLLVADEAIAALDVSVQAEVVEQLATLSRELDLAILFITHDLAVVQTLCSRTAVIQRGVLVEQGPTAEIYAHPREEYTRALIDAVPRFDSAFLDGAGRR